MTVAQIRKIRVILDNGHFGNQSISPHWSKYIDHCTEGTELFVQNSRLIQVKNGHLVKFH